MANDLSAQLGENLGAKLRAKLNPPVTAAAVPADTYAQLAHLITSLADTPTEAPPRDARLVDLNVTSLTLIELMVQVEQKFGVQIESATAQNFVTVGDVVTYLETAAEKP